MSTNSVFSPYGAFEMKASYQKNLLIGNLIVVGLTLTIVSLFWIISLFVTPLVVVIGPFENNRGGLVGENHRIPLDAETLRQRGNRPQIQLYPGVIPNPIPDDEFIDDEVPVLISVETYAGGDGIDSNYDDNLYTGEGNPSYVYGGSDEIYPGETDFVPFEKEPEMYYYKQPSYPRLCKLAGIEGVVTIKVLIGKDGLVIKAKIARSSGSDSLDAAALSAAKDNKFSPALQNSNPISLCVSYKVTFTLE